MRWQYHVSLRLPNPNVFSVARNHFIGHLADTTRPKKPHEKEGVEYHFVTKQQFDTDVVNNK